MLSLVPSNISTIGGPSSRREVILSDNALLEEKILKSAIAAIGRRAEFRDMFMLWPNLHTSCLMLALYASDIIPDSEGQPLIHRCLDDGINAYLQFNCSDQASVCAFMQGIVQHYGCFLNTLVFCQTTFGYRAWEPFAEPLVYWLRKNKSPQVFIEKKSDIALPHHMKHAKNMFFARLFTMRDLISAGGDIEKILDSY